MEIWKDIEGYEGLYQVSNQGRVKRLEGAFGKKYSERILKPSNHKARQSVCVALRDRQGKVLNKSLAKLVLTTFKGKPPRLARNTRHIDGDLTNNKLENLEWYVTEAYYKPRNEEARERLNKEAEAIVYSCLNEKGRSQLVNFGFCDVDDLAQECLIQIWNRIDWYDSTRSFAGFCYMICDKVFKSFYKKYKPKRARCINFTDIVAGEEKDLDRVSILSND